MACGPTIHPALRVHLLKPRCQRSERVWSLVCRWSKSLSVRKLSLNAKNFNPFTVNLNDTLASERVENCLTTCAISHAITSLRFLKWRPYDLSEKHSRVRKFLTRQVGGLRLGCIRHSHIFPESCLGYMVELTMSFGLQAVGANVLPGSASHLFSFHHT